VELWRQETEREEGGWTRKQQREGQEKMRVKERGGGREGWGAGLSRQWQKLRAWIGENDKG
jgi:hypothetical protein